MFLTDMKGPWPAWYARVYALQVADGSQALYELLVDELTPRLKDVAKVIDVGCGPGHPTELLARRLPDADVLGVDLSEIMIGIATQKRETRDNLRFEVGDALDLGHPDGMFDAAISFLSIKAWPDQQKGAQEMARLVRPRGWVGVFECDADCSKLAAQNFASMWRWNLGLPGHVAARMGRAWYFRRIIARNGVRHDELRALLEHAGLTELESFSWPDQPVAFAIGRKP